VQPVTYFRDFDQDEFGDANSTVSVCETLPPTGYITDSSDCNDRALLFADVDGDGHGAGDFTACGVTTSDDECPNTAARIAPIDWYGDADQDGAGDPAVISNACDAPAGFVGNTNDQCPAIGALQSPVVYFIDTDADGFGVNAATTAVCETSAPAGYSAFSTDCNDAVATSYPGAPELCNVVDDDCDTVVDEDLVFSTYYRDADGDSHGDAAVTESNCTGSPSSGHVRTSGDCDDGRAEVHAMAPFHIDVDLDGFGVSQTAMLCEVVAPSGYSSNATDCNDGAIAINPGATEVCYASDTDENCSGSADDADPSVSAASKFDFFADADADTFTVAGATRFCDIKPGFLAAASPAIDCNDGNPAINPSVAETCNGIDDDCTGAADDGLTFTTYYRDADGDGAGDPAVTTTACSQPAGYVPNAGDRCPQNGGKTEPGVCGCDVLDADSDADGRIDCMDLHVSLSPLEPFIEYGREYVVRVTASTVTPTTPLNLMTGMQLAARFDKERLELIDVRPVEAAPFTLPIGSDINNTAGTLRYAIGTNDGDSGLSTSRAIVDLVFMARPDADLCSQDIVLVWLQTVGSWETLFVSSDSLPASPSLAGLPPTDLDTTDPVLSGIPASISIATDAGSTYGAYIEMPSVTATDNCTQNLVPQLAIIYPDGTTADATPSGNMFPIGTTTLVWTIADETGNDASETHTIEVLDHQLLDIVVTYEVITRFASTRNIRVTAGGEPQIVEVSLPAAVGSTFPEATRLGIEVPVQATHACISAKDRDFSISATAAGAMDGRRYKAAFTIIAGDSNDDNKVDIGDFSIFVADQGPVDPYALPRSDFNSSSIVGNDDFGIICTNFFKRGDVCTAFDGGEPASRVSVRQLRRDGLGHLAVADLNGDGWVDVADIQAYMTGAPVSVRPDTAEKARGGW